MVEPTDVGEVFDIGKRDDRSYAQAINLARGVLARVYGQSSGKYGQPQQGLTSSHLRFMLYAFGERYNFRK